MIASLVFGRSLRRVGRSLLQDGSDSDGGWRAGLVEEGDDVLGLVLFVDCQLVL